jgi:LysM repeat protein
MKEEKRMKRFCCCLISGLVVAMLFCAAPVGAAPPNHGHDQESVTHTVQRGENLYRIALRYGTTVNAIVAANGLANPNRIYVGQRLVIPGDTGSAGTTAPSATTGSTYVVQRGDTLSGIARRFGTTTTSLARLNGIANPSLIYIGQVLRLSGTGTAPAPSGGSKRIVVDLSEQHLYAYEGSRLVYSFVASSGAAPYYTRTGEFSVLSKIPNAYGSSWGFWMPHWLGIYWAGSAQNGIHALPVSASGQTLWASCLGRPMSYGCIVLGSHEAQLLYNWAQIGTPVSIRY